MGLDCEGGCAFLSRTAEGPASPLLPSPQRPRLITPGIGGSDLPGVHALPKKSGPGGWLGFCSPLSEGLEGQGKEWIWQKKKKKEWIWQSCQQEGFSQVLGGALSSVQCGLCSSGLEVGEAVPPWTDGAFYQTDAQMDNTCSGPCPALLQGIDLDLFPSLLHNDHQIFIEYVLCS